MSLLQKKYVLETGKIDAAQFDLPERIVQFGTGVLLRGLVDFLIDKANKKGVFNGRIVVVKTTDSDASDFDRQDSIFTLNERGVSGDALVNQSTIVTAISRVVSATDDWSAVLDCAENLDFDIIVSNTTEAGLKFVADADINATPPPSFPSKLTAFLVKRFHFVGGKGGGLVIVPTELLVGNGDILRGFVEQHGRQHGLSEAFFLWLATECRFCNSLVDRIVPGAPSATEKIALQNALGYEDNLMVNAESFLLWAIEGDDFVRQKLRFAATDERVIIVENIEKYREQKLRILNGGHTIAVPLAFLKGLKTVGEMMNDAVLGEFVVQVVQKEILKTLNFDAAAFANAVLDRFRNPFIEHQLLSITLQCSAKMNSRNALTFSRYVEKMGVLPEKMTLGFAAYLLFMRPTKVENGQFFGQNTEGSFYKINDEHAAFFADEWRKTDDMDLASLCDFVEKVLDNEAIFNKSFKKLPNFIERVAELMFDLTTKGIRQTIEKSLILQ